MPQPFIAVVGSSNTDMIIRLDRIPRPGETILGGEFLTAAGGKGANQAVAAARAGGAVTFIARVGDDMFGTRAVEGFRADGIDTCRIVTDSGAPSGVALIFVDKAGENCIAVASGANARLTPADLDGCADAVAFADMLLLQLEIPLETVRAAVKLARASGVPVILNPAPACPLGDDLLCDITALTPNETEAELLTGIPVTDEDSARRAAGVMRERGVRTVIITLGARGAYVASDTFQGIVSGYRVEAVDTTAAGDVFNGALAVALAEGTDLPAAVRFANAAAALSVTTVGAQPSAPSRDRVLAFMGERR